MHCLLLCRSVQKLPAQTPNLIRECIIIYDAWWSGFEVRMLEIRHENENRMNLPSAVKGREKKWLDIECFSRLWEWRHRETIVFESALQLSQKLVVKAKWKSSKEKAALNYRWLNHKRQVQLRVLNKKKTNQSRVRKSQNRDYLQRKATTAREKKELNVFEQLASKINSRLFLSLCKLAWNEGKKIHLLEVLAFPGCLLFIRFVHSI